MHRKISIGCLAGDNLSKSTHVGYSLIQVILLHFSKASDGVPSLTVNITSRNRFLASITPYN